MTYTVMSKRYLRRLVETGVDAKIAIQNGLVEVNGQVETQRGKKLYDGDLVSFQGEEIKIVK